MKLVFGKDKEKVMVKAADLLVSLLQKRKGMTTLLLLAGGSWFEVLNTIENPPSGPWLTIGCSDERWSTDPSVNNFSQLSETAFFKSAKENGTQFLNTKVKRDETLLELGRRMDAYIETWIVENSHGKIIQTFGIGPDGHTCGMMPFPENPKRFKTLFESRALAVGYDAKGKNEYDKRATVTATFVKKYVSEGIVFAVGKNKQKALSNIVKKNGALADVPARVLREIPVTLCTDVSV